MSATRLWIALDARFYSDPKIVALADLFGPAGPFAIIVLLGAAKTEGDTEGNVRMRYGALARFAHLKGPGIARQIVRAAGQEGILTDVRLGREGFLARFPAWGRWQRADAAAAQRKRAQRDREKAEASTMDDTTAATVRWVFAKWVEILRAESTPAPKLTPARANKIKARLKEGYERDRFVRAFVGCKGSAHHMGENEGQKRYDDITLICRTGDDLERFEGYPPPGDDGLPVGSTLKPSGPSEGERREREEAELMEALGD